MSDGMVLQMGKVIDFTNLTLGGVMQAPGRPDEDTRDFFKHGGWAVPFGAFAALNLRDTKTTNKGVVIATYQPAAS